MLHPRIQYLPPDKRQTFRINDTKNTADELTAEKKYCKEQIKQKKKNAENPPHSEKRTIMAEQKNISKEAQALSAGIADRAIWFHLLIAAAEKQNVDIEQLTDDAIFTFGKNLFKDKKAETAAEFVALMTAPGIGQEAFDQEVIVSDENHAVAHFHACPLVAAWKSYGLSDERVKLLCRLACKGDFGRASNFPKIEIDFPKTIGNGDPYCELAAKNRQ